MILRNMCAGLAGLAVVMSGAALAGPPAPYAPFEAKRVKPPGPGTKKRITVQIDPSTVRPPPKPAPSEPDPAQVADGESGGGEGADFPVGDYAWFWDRISPELAMSGPGRLDDALSVLSGAHQVAAPRLQTLQDIARERGVPILRSTIGTSVSPALVLAVISVESAGRADAVSGAGAAGLMQLMPATASRFGVKDSFEPEENIAAGVKYLDFLMQEFGHDPILVLAGYNAGEGSIRNYGGVPPFAETRDYVPKVLAAFKVARGLCATPPQLISDGCVFVSME